MKKLGISFLIFVTLLIIIIGIYFSPIGSYFLKNYVKERLCFADKFKVSYFNHSINSFSMTLSNKTGYVQIFGTFLPFDVSYNANFSDIATIIKYLKGNLNSTGEISNIGNQASIKGNYIYSKGYGTLDLNCTKESIQGLIKGKNFNTKILLKNIKGFSFPIFQRIPIEGSNDIKLNLKDHSEITSTFEGFMSINSMKFPLESEIKINFLNREDFAFSSNVFSSEIKGKINGLQNKKSLSLTGDLSVFDLKLIRKNLLYPLSGKVPMKFKYNNQSGVFSFSSEYFTGYSDENTINIQINMPLYKFFEFLKIPQILNGKISGNIIINNNKGIFNLLIENASFVPNKIIKRLDAITYTKLENIKSIYFLNGNFDSQKIVFDFISKNSNYYIYLKRGFYYYDGLYNLSFDLKTRTDSYKFNITNGQIKLIEHLKKGINYKTLVY